MSQKQKLNAELNVLRQKVAAYENDGTGVTRRNLRERIARLAGELRTANEKCEALNKRLAEVGAKLAAAETIIAKLDKEFPLPPVEAA